MKKRKLTGAIFILLPFVAILLHSCYYDYGIDSTNLDVVGTFYDKNYDFSQVNTYFLPDSVVHSEDLSSQYDAQVISKVQDELNALGWTRLFPGGTDTADMTVLISALNTTTTVAYYNDWWSYWGWYGGWGYYPTYGYGSGWGWNYPYYSTSYYTYTTGSVIVQMTDPRRGDAGGSTLAVQWLGVVNGLLDGANISGRINTGLGQAFNQSPYLNP